MLSLAAIFVNVFVFMHILRTDKALSVMSSTMCQQEVVMVVLAGDVSGSCILT